MPRDFRGKTVTADLIWHNGSFQRDLLLRISSDGRIESILDGSSSPDRPNINLRNIALIPGFINAHSHAFHRQLRGRSGIGGPPSMDSFWKWRDAMYKLVEEVTYEQIVEFCSGTFREMLAAGITTVGEFHYVHHGQKRFDLDRAVIEAAMNTGIRLVLIETLYCRSTFNSTTVEPQQSRFHSTFEEFKMEMERLKECITKISENGQITLAAAAHSLRAVGVQEVAKLREWSSSNRIPFHIHIEEQPKEVRDSLEAIECLNKRPLEVITDLVINNEQIEHEKTTLTAVHCTHSTRESLDRFAKCGGIVCVCPMTEGFLGDGIPDLSENDYISLGTDCNNRISMLEEMRWLAFCQNMKNNRRNGAGLSANKLFEISTVNGARSLGLSGETGYFHPGHFFDFVGINLNGYRLRDFTKKTELLDALVFGCGNSEIEFSGVSGIIKFVNE